MSHSAAGSFAKTVLRPTTTSKQWIDALRFCTSDTFTSELPGDTEVSKSPYQMQTDSEGKVDVPQAKFRTSRTVRGALWSWAVPMEQEGPRLISVSGSGAALVGLTKETFLSDAKAAAEIWSGNARLPGSNPWAQCYGGHQFGIWADQLGDGRAISLGEVDGCDQQQQHSSRWEIQLKGAGRTPYSRFGDGYAVRRSSIREYLAAEHLHALGIPTSRSLALVFTERLVEREETEFGAVVTRLAPSWIRFGSFELPASRNDYKLVQTLADYTIRRHYPEIGANLSNDSIAADACGEDKYAMLLRKITRQTALMIARWQAYGFCHGVMNTDNMSVLGLTIDYGPFAFLDAYEPGFICNHSDTSGRYAFDEQPRVALWNLMRLANPLAVLINGGGAATKESVEGGKREELKPETVKAITDILNQFGVQYRQEYVQIMRRKLGLFATEESEDLLDVVQPFLDLLEHAKTDYTFAMRALCDAPFIVYGSPPNSSEKQLEVLVDSLAERSLTFSCAADSSGWKAQAIEYFQKKYLPRLSREMGADGGHALASEIAARMKAVNPKYVLRNWVAQDIIEQAEKGDERAVDNALDLLTKFAFEDRLPDYLASAEKYAGPVPKWGEGLQCSCSS
ncbi:hypothetical protein H4R99_002178 [Coemansia sp. RSA 1722]|nr:hypothetical protein IWW45_003123 [Coemansia sp. RSA 485]KAJ2602092.1 hypothetical protein GGF39_000921 [Coemansia sp. RSA 1721]KAJ2603881.1 hypothetical protein H4R99_002178 [Coemansia sp. RSA 1722]